MTTNESIQAIQERNKRVEADKAWEGSWTRRLFIALLTYIVVVVLFSLLGNDVPFIIGIVPPIGYIVSTLTLPPLKRWWIKRQGLR